MKNEHARFATTLAAMVAALSLAACYPTASISGVNELDTVATAREPTANFAGYNTFTVPAYCPPNADAGACDGGIPQFVPDGGTATNVTHAYDQFILQTIVNNFTDAGYTYVPIDANSTPSFTVLVGVNASTYTSYYYPWYYYWGGYYPGGYPWYGYGWYPYPIYSQYDVGTLLIFMSVPDAPNMNLNGVWTASIRGVLAQGTVSQTTRLQTDINQAFTQSPYLMR